MTNLFHPIIHQTSSAGWHRNNVWCDLKNKIIPLSIQGINTNTVPSSPSSHIALSGLSSHAPDKWMIDWSSSPSSKCSVPSASALTLASVVYAMQYTFSRRCVVNRLLLYYYYYYYCYSLSLIQYGMLCYVMLCFVFCCRRRNEMLISGHWNLILIVSRRNSSSSSSSSSCARRRRSFFWSLLQNRLVTVCVRGRM